jgi:hypothetical protein
MTSISDKNQFGQNLKTIIPQFNIKCLGGQPHNLNVIGLILPYPANTSFGLSEWRSGKIDVGNEHQRLSPLKSWVRFPVKPIPHVIERATLWQRRFPPTYITNRPILSMELNNVLVDAQLSIQYYFKYFQVSLKPTCFSPLRRIIRIQELTHSTPDLSRWHHLLEKMTSSTWADDIIYLSRWHHLLEQMSPSTYIFSKITVWTGKYLKKSITSWTMLNKFFKFVPKCVTLADNSVKNPKRSGLNNLQCISIPIPIQVEWLNATENGIIACLAVSLAWLNQPQQN